MEERLQKILSAAGICSRRASEAYLTAARVTVNGEAAQLGQRADPETDVICVDGVPVKTTPKPIYVMLNKPRGYVTTVSDEQGRKTVMDLLRGIAGRIYPVGRLDKDSTGLLLLTNDGELVNKIMRAGNYHEKEYLVSVNKPVTEEFCRKMSRGVAILDTVTRPCKVEKAGEKSFRIILTQGLNRQIRRMCETLGYRVMTLQRVRIMNIRLGSLKEGTWRNIEGEERKELDALLSDSSSLSVKERNEKQRERRGGI